MAVLNSNLNAAPRNKGVGTGDCRGFLTVEGYVINSNAKQIAETSWFARNLLAGQCLETDVAQVLDKTLTTFILEY